MLIIDGDRHGIQVNIKTNKGHYWAIDLFLFSMGNIEFIPEAQKAHLLGREVVVIRFIVKDIANNIKRSIVITISFDVWDLLDLFGNPGNQ